MGSDRNCFVNRSIYGRYENNTKHIYGWIFAIHKSRNSKYLKSKDEHEYLENNEKTMNYFFRCSKCGTAFRMALEHCIYHSEDNKYATARCLNCNQLCHNEKSEIERFKKDVKELLEHFGRLTKHAVVSESADETDSKSVG